MPKAMPPLRLGDLHFVVNATQDDKVGEISPAKLYNHSGKLLRQMESLAQGVEGPSYQIVGGDTVPGLYVVSYVKRSQPDESEAVWASFAEWYLHLGPAPGFPDPQAEYERSGIGIHGGGSALGIRYKDRLLPLKSRTLCLAPRQKLVATHGCVRLHNDDMEWFAGICLTAYANRNTVFVTVVQD